LKHGDDLSLKGRVRKQSAGEDIWAQEGVNNRRQLHNENIHDSYLSDQINKSEMGEKYDTSWKKKSACSVLGGKPLGTQSVDGSVLLIWVLEHWNEGILHRFICLSLGTEGLLTIR
jgi:hypothetical protein